jgi:tetratricopeptide (TPR) repeat protein
MAQAEDKNTLRAPAPPSSALPSDSTADRRLDPEEEACRAWALKLQKAVSGGDKLFLYNALDWQALGKKVQVKNLPPILLSKLMEGVQGGAKLTGESICADVGAGGQYKLIALRRQGGQWKALFRVLNKGGAFNYHDFFLARGRDGRIGAVDLYIGFSGEAFSDTLARIVKFALNLVQKPSKEMTALAEIFSRYSALVGAGKRQEAVALLDGVPRVFQHEKWILMGRLSQRAEVSEERYTRLIEEAQKYFPDDPAFDLVSLGYWGERKNYDRALQAIIRLKSFAEEDAFRDAYEAKLHSLKGDLPAASLLIQKAIAKEPDLKMAHWIKLEIDLGMWDFPAVADTLLILEKRFGERIPALEQLDNFSLFVKSEQYALWQAARKSAQVPVLGKP